MQAELDEWARTYVREDPRITFAEPEDGPARRLVISALERLAGRSAVEAVYRSLKTDRVPAHEFFSEALRRTGIDVRQRGANLDTVRKDGPLVIVANHPFGIIDGLVLCDIALRLRGDFRLLIHALLCQDATLARYFLPIDFSDRRQAVRNNIHSRRRALSALRDGIPVAIFPSGAVSTAKTMLGFGPVEEYPWSTFVARLVSESAATVLPVCFDGRNSRAFHIVSGIAEPLRLGMLLHESKRQFGRRIEVTIGAPISSEDLPRSASRQRLTEFLRDRVMSMRTD